MTTIIGHQVSVESQDVVTTIIGHQVPMDAVITIIGHVEQQTSTWDDTMNIMGGMCILLVVATALTELDKVTDIGSFLAMEISN